MSDHHTKKLGEILVDRGYLTADQLQTLLTLQKSTDRRIGEIVVEKGYLDEEVLTDILAEHYQLPRINLDDVHVNEKLLSLFSYEILEKHHVFPVEIKDQVLLVATNNPLDVDALQEVRYISGYAVQPVITSLSDIHRQLERSSGSINAMNALKNANLREAQEAPVIKLTNSIISKSIEEGASDIHLEPHKEGMRIRSRVDGILREKMQIPADVAKKVISRIKILSDMDVAENRRPQDGRMSFIQGTSEYDVRISTLPDLYGENMVCRILNKSFIYHDLSSLGLAESEIQFIKQLISKPYGMILVTGPTGAGKTTTLYSILNLLNDVSKNIITVEDPVEYELPGINQTAANPYTGYGFATAIRHILRHDPDVIMIGEIRDMETAEMAIRAALTGHLVLSTLHTNSAAGAITRLIDMGIEPFLISSAVIGVLAQRLVRRLCPHCRQLSPFTEELQKQFPPRIVKEGGKDIASAQGCSKCHESGFAGRVGLYECLKVTEPLRKMILNSDNEQVITQYAVEQHGMQTLRDAGLRKTLQHETTLDEVMRVTYLEDEAT